MYHLFVEVTGSKIFSNMRRDFLETAHTYLRPLTIPGSPQLSESALGYGNHKDPVTGSFSTSRGYLKRKGAAEAGGASVVVSETVFVIFGRTYFFDFIFLHQILLL